MDGVVCGNDSNEVRLCWCNGCVSDLNSSILEYITEVWVCSVGCKDDFEMERRLSFVCGVYKHALRAMVVGPFNTCCGVCSDEECFRVVVVIVYGV